MDVVCVDVGVMAPVLATVDCIWDDPCPVACWVVVTALLPGGAPLLVCCSTELLSWPNIVLLALLLVPCCCCWVCPEGAIEFGVPGPIADCGPGGPPPPPEGPGCMAPPGGPIGPPGLNPTADAPGGGPCGGPLSPQGPRSPISMLQLPWMFPSSFGAGNPGMALGCNVSPERSMPGLTTLS